MASSRNPSGVTCMPPMRSPAAESNPAEISRRSGANLVIGHVVACYGAADRFLGMLAATLGDLEGAKRHFEDALELNRRMGARTWLAHTAYEYGRMLLRRREGAHLRATRDQCSDEFPPLTERNN